MNLTEIQEKLNKSKELSKNIDKQITDLETDLKWNHPQYNCFQGTYLESKQSIIELYKLFLFYGMLEYYFDHEIGAGDSFC
jgi:hypothetical protein